MIRVSPPIIHHAVVHTAGVPETTEAVAVRAGRVIAGGSNTAALDLTMPDRDITTIDARGIGQTVVQLTVVGGNIVYEKNTQK